MDREQFMKLLDHYFRDVDETTYKEIKNDYEKHFRIRAGNGKTEEEIPTELGNPRETFNECKEVETIRGNNFFGMSSLDNIGDLFNSKISNRSKDEDYDLSQQALEFDSDFHRIGAKSNADIDVSTHELDRIAVTYTTTGESQKLDIDYMNHVLKFGKVKMEKFFQKSFVKSIPIKIPQSGDLGLNIATTSGDVHVDAISSDIVCNTSGDDIGITTQSSNVNVNTTNGSVQAFKCKREIYVNTVSGDAKTASENPEITMNTVSGDIKIDVDESKDLNIRGISSDIDISIKEKKGSIEPKTVSGEIKIDSYYKDSSKKTSKSHDQSFTSDDVKISAATVSGNITVD